MSSEVSPGSDAEPGAEQQPPSAEAVVGFLKAHPDFFEQFPDALVAVSLPSAHGGRAISLHERQLEILRERNRQLEQKLSDLVRIGQENDAITDKLQKWTRQLLLEPEAERLPTIITDGLTGIFSVPQVALRLWSVRAAWRELPFAAPVVVDAITLANGMKQPYCGPNNDVLAAAWLPGEGADTRSVALVPLRKGLDPNAFGLLVMGSADADRFRAGMGTTFLERIGETASAALSRLIE